MPLLIIIDRNGCCRRFFFSSVALSLDFGSRSRFRFRLTHGEANENAFFCFWANRLDIFVGLVLFEYQMGRSKIGWN